MGASSRRGFLSFLAAAPVAAKSVAQDVGSRLGVLRVIPGTSIQGVEFFEQGPFAGSLGQIYLSDLAKTVTQQLLELDDLPLSTFLRSVKSLDVDIASMRSLSASAAVRLQAVRNRELHIESRRFDLNKKLRLLSEEATRGAST